MTVRYMTVAYLVGSGMTAAPDDGHVVSLLTGRRLAPSFVMCAQRSAACGPRGSAGWPRAGTPL